MSARHIGAGGLLLAALVAGTMSDVPKASVSWEMNGYQVLAADFHVHSFPFTWSTLSPWDTVVEARYQGLDVIARTPHNRVWAAKAGRWFSRAIGGPMVLVGKRSHRDATTCWRWASPTRLPRVCRRNARSTRCTDREAWP